MTTAELPLPVPDRVDEPVPVESRQIEMRLKSSGRVEPYLTGTRVGVLDVWARHTTDGMSVDALVENYPRLGRAAIHAALAFCYANPMAVERLQAEIEREADRISAANPLPEKLTRVGRGDRS